jgi:hypothetical protein
MVLGVTLIGITVAQFLRTGNVSNNLLLADLLISGVITGSLFDRVFPK